MHMSQLHSCMVLERLLVSISTMYMLCIIVWQTAANMSVVGLEAGPRQALNIECCDLSGPLDS